MRRAHKFLEAFLISWAKNFDISWQTKQYKRPHKVKPKTKSRVATCEIYLFFINISNGPLRKKPKPAYSRYLSFIFINKTKEKYLYEVKYKFYQNKGGYDVCWV